MTLNVNFGTLVTLFPFKGLGSTLLRGWAIINTFQPQVPKESLPAKQVLY